LTGRGPQLALQRGDGHVDDRVVHHDQQQAEAHHAEDDPAAPIGGWAGGWGGRGRHGSQHVPPIYETQEFRNDSVRNLSTGTVTERRAARDGHSSGPSGRRSPVPGVSYAACRADYDPLGTEPRDGSPGRSLTGRLGMNRPARGLLVAFGVALLGAGALAGCGNDDAAGDESETTTTETSTTTTPPTTEPPATDVEAVRPIIEELAADYDAALAAVLVEPDQVLDPESPVHEQLAAVFTDDELARRVERFEQNANRGIVFSPLGPEPLWVTTVVGEIEPDGPDALRVVI